MIDSPGQAANAKEALIAELAEIANALPDRIDVDPDSVGRDLGRLVLTLVELIRRVVEHQAVRRMDDGDLSDDQVERMGMALSRLEEKMGEMRSSNFNSLVAVSK